MDLILGECDVICCSSTPRAKERNIKVSKQKLIKHSSWVVQIIGASHLKGALSRYLVGNFIKS